MVFNGVNFVVKDGINQAAFVNALNEQNWDFKYKSYFPNLFMDNITIDTKTKKAIANRINILELSNVKNLDTSNKNNLYYFKGIVSITNLKYNNYTTQPNVYLFSDDFNSDPNNYLFSRYGGNQVAIYKDKSISYNSNFSSSRNTKFKNANTTSINGRINEMEKFFTNLKNKVGI